MLRRLGRPAFIRLPVGPRDAVAFILTYVQFMRISAKPDVPAHARPLH